MKTLIRRIFLLVATLLLAGCNYDAALTAQPTRKIDERLLGVWLGGDEGKDPMIVRALDEFTYVAAMDDEIYRAQHSDFADRPFISVQELQKDRRYLFLTAEVSADGKKLTLHTVNVKVIPEGTKGREALQKLLNANLTNPKLFSEALVYTRKP